MEALSRKIGRVTIELRAQNDPKPCSVGRRYVEARHICRALAPELERGRPQPDVRRSPCRLKPAGEKWLHCNHSGCGKTKDTVAFAEARRICAMVSRLSAKRTTEHRHVKMSGRASQHQRRAASANLVRACCPPAPRPLRTWRKPPHSGRACGAGRLEHSAAGDSP